MKDHNHIDPKVINLQCIGYDTMEYYYKEARLMTFIIAEME